MPMRGRQQVVFPLLLSVAGCVVLGAQTFRATVDVVQLDVSVLDKDRRPVLGLTRDDVTVLVDGKPRPVVAFSAVDVPPPPQPSAPWIRDIAPDVVTNVRPSGRVVVIVIDDGGLAQSASGPTQSEVGGVRAIRKTREIARAAVDNLGPSDLGSVMFTESNRTAQEFTSDRARLLAAINDARMFPGPSASAPDDLRVSDPLGIMRGSCFCGLCSIEALERVAIALRALPQQRKTVLYVSVGSPVAQQGVSRPEDNQTYRNMALACNGRQRDAMARVFRQAQLSNVTIQTIDPKGLTVGDMASVAPDDPLAGASTLRLDFLRTVAETTGGRAVVNNNDMEREVPALFEETRSYYLIGVESGVTSDDGKVHKVQVRVNRPGVEVRTREGFYVPTTKERREMAARASSSLEDSIAGPLAKGDVQLDVSVAPFAESGGGRRAALAIVLGVTRPLDLTRRREARTERIDVLSAAFHPETGKGQGERRQTFDVAIKPTGSDSALFEVMSRLPVAPGRYQVRLGVKTADGKTGSVYSDVDVPDFGRDPLALSGLILSAAPAPKAAPPDAFKDLTPRLPTARRQFRPTDRVIAFARVYRGRSAARLPVPRATTRLTAESNEVIAERLDTLAAGTWASLGYADYELPVPMANLAAGEYLLTVEVAAGGATVQRAVRFRLAPQESQGLK